MVQWRAEEKAATTSAWKQVDVDVDGHETLARVLIIYPLPQRFFSNNGSLSSVAAILGNPNVREHSRKALSALAGAVNNMDIIKGTVAHRSKRHAEKLHVDPQNLQLLGNCLIMDLTPKKSTAFIRMVEVGWQNFLLDVCATLSKVYR